MSINGTALLLIGCGKMGGALLRRVLSSRLATRICVVEPSAVPANLQSDPRLSWLASPDMLNASFVPDIVIVAIKPQHIMDVLGRYGRYKSSVFLSIAAGTPIAKLESALRGNTYAIVRSMPNLPASIGEGISVAVSNKNVSAAQRALADTFLKAIGETVWVEDEKLIDAVTALSGTGPAYVFALCEAMAKAGEVLGLSADLAALLARETVIGSGVLLGQSSESPEILRRAVTSPGGTTEAALCQLLASGGLPDIMLKAMKAAADRAKELAR